MRKLAERIEYSPTAIYAYFADKDALLRSLCEHDFAVMLSDGEHLLKIRDPLERVVALGQFYVGFALTHGHQFQYMFMTPAAGSDDTDAAVTVYALFRSTVAEVVASGRLRPEYKDVDLLAQALWAAMHGVAALHVARRYDIRINARPPIEIARTAIESMLSGLLQARERPARKPATKARRRRA